MAKFKINENYHNGTKFHRTQYLFFCEGCNEEHAISLKAEGGNHSFNMDLNNPTVSPSVLCNFTPDRTCHSFIRDGKIQYLNDCWHFLRGHTVELQQFNIEDNEEEQN